MADLALLPILETKLHRPPVTPDLVCRGRLHERMNEALRTPLTLVSAPAGYGKSVLVGQWADSLEQPCAWLSLDEGDGEVAVFLAYVQTAVGRLLPEACAQTEALLQAPDLPPRPVLTRTLVNDLDAIETPFVLVLDDYHRIDDSAVNELLAELLEHPPRCLHVVIATRRDPALPLATLRARGQLTEMRLSDLEFALPETAAALKHISGISPGELALANLQRTVEGWAAGLRLVALALRHQEDPDGFLAEVSGDLQSVQDYLVGEVLGDQSPAMREWLLKTAILNRFCSRLCDAVCLPELPDEESEGIDIDGESFIAKLGQGGLFVIALDHRREWLRYHHLFQRLLQERLEREHGRQVIAALHARASRWLEEQGLLEEAIRHGLAAGEPALAADVLKKHGHEQMLQEQCSYLERLLGRLPPRVVDRDPMLLVFAGWTHQVRTRVPELAAVIERIDACLAGSALPAAESEGLAGCLDVLRAAHCTWTADISGVRELANRALQSMPPDFLRLRLMAILSLTVADLMSGRHREAVARLRSALAEGRFREGHPRGLLLAGFCCACWLQGRLPEMRQYAAQISEIGETSGVALDRAWGTSYGCASRYQRNDLEELQSLLKESVENPYQQHAVLFIDDAAILAYTYQAQGRAREARAVADRVVDHGLDAGSELILVNGKALRAEIAIRQGRLQEAAAWAESVELSASGVQFGFYVQELTLAHVLVGLSSPEDRRRARSVLSTLEESARAAGNRPVLIPVLALTAIMLDQQGEEAAALARLAEAISEATPGGCLRFFLDLGPPIANLLPRLARTDDAELIRDLLAAFEEEGEPAGEQEPAAASEKPPSGIGRPLLAEELTKREQQILELLAQRLSDKEIASTLFVSPATVNSHLKHLYQKLQVRSRRQAVAEGQALGILTRR